MERLSGELSWEDESPLSTHRTPYCGDTGGPCDFQINVPEPVETELRSDRAQGRIRRVTVGAQMGEKDVFEMFGGTLRDQARSIDVGEVALPAPYALFERPRARSLAQEIFVVIGFQYNGTASFELLLNQ